MTAWPNLFVVGAQRCGTTSLWAYLGQHPEIFMARVKEPHFFSGDPSAATITDPVEYLELFAGHSERWRGEASPSYIWHTAAAPAIREASPEARIIISLRDPIDRALSIYSFLHRYGRETRTFSEVVRADLARTDDAMPASLFVGQSRYATRVERYLDLFGPDHVRVLVFEEFVASTRKTMTDLFTFLDLDPTPAETLRYDAHASSAPPRNKLAAAVLEIEPIRVLGRRLLQRLASPSARAAIENRMLKGEPPADEIDEETRALLSAAFADDRTALETVLGRALPWPRTD